MFFEASGLDQVVLQHPGHDFAVCGVPDVVAAADPGAEVLHARPGAVHVELIAVAPDVEEAQVLARGEEGVRKVHQPLVVVVAGGVPGAGVGRQAEAARGLDPAAVEQARVAHGHQNPRVAVAEGIGHAQDRPAELPLQRELVLADLLGERLVRELVEAGVRAGVSGDLVPRVERGQDFRVHAPHEHVLVLPGVFPGLDAGIEVKVPFRP